MSALVYLARPSPNLAVGGDGNLIQLMKLFVEKDIDGYDIFVLNYTLQLYKNVKA